MALVTDEIELSGNSPVQILSSSLVARHVEIAGSGAYLGSANNNAHGYHMFDYRTTSFTLAAGDSLWAWADSLGTGVIQILASTALGL